MAEPSRYNMGGRYPVTQTIPCIGSLIIAYSSAIRRIIPTLGRWNSLAMAESCLAWCQTVGIRVSTVIIVCTAPAVKGAAEIHTTLHIATHTIFTTHGGGVTIHCTVAMTAICRSVATCTIDTAATIMHDFSLDCYSHLGYHTFRPRIRFLVNILLVPEM